MALLGIDVGTGGSRALLIDEQGKVLASATDEHEPFASPQTGWAEQSPDDWWRATRASVRAVLSQGSWTALLGHQFDRAELTVVYRMKNSIS